ncbi:MAG TPA: fibronectin type III domain-containing protein, partial [Thermoplasmata archaeon]|nr:fibronectin type III domain-containing protein [Thermoplasmata archaeon]
SAPPNAWSSEHRPLMTSDAPMVMGLWDGLFDNGSWLFDPTEGQFLSTNVSFDHARGGPTYRQNSQSPASVENLFVNSTYAIVSESVDCRTPGTSCPIRGSSPGTAPGTIWWTWRLGQPEFPYSPTVQGAETGPPGPSTVSGTAGAHSVNLRWSPPTTNADPILNYTLFWSTPPNPGLHVVDLWAQNSSFTITGLPSGQSVDVLLQAWNLHWHNPGTWFNTSTTSTPPLTLTGITVEPDPTDAGLPFLVRVNASGGEPPLSYGFNGLPDPCGDPRTSAFECTAVSDGTFVVTATVTDGANASVSGSATIAVHPPPGITALRAVPSAVAPGQTFRLEWGLSGGTGVLNLTLEKPLGACTALGANVTQVTCQLPSEGMYSILLDVTDQLGSSNQSSTMVEVRASPPPAGAAATWELVLGGVGLSVAAAVGIAFVLVRRRRERRKPGG